ncbi:MAG: NAD(P)/FAD-dependent oxidoreductase [Candidatus Aminicenantes bacterium]|nr:NAD(P)/FAD-dependent oxidoreductase [Candidatus Aminicenantes bacterium]
MIKEHDVIVVGGGPSGLNSARRLSEKGLDVVVLERKEEIGKNVICTGIVGKEAFDRFSLATNSVLMEVQQFKMVSPNMTSVLYSHAHPFAYVVDREKFDKNLADEAVSKGAILKLCHEVVDINSDDNYVNIVAKINGLQSVTFRAKALILATGIDIRHNKKLGLGYAREYIYGIQSEISFKQKEYPEIFVGKDVTPGAFAWIVPVSKEKARIGLLAKSEPRAYFEKFIQKLFPDFPIDLIAEKVMTKPIAQGLIKKSYGNRILVVGEAAGQVKTTTGGGIFFGLLCSDIASKEVVQRFKEDVLSEKDLSAYEKNWKKEIQKEILVGYYTRKICEKLSDNQVENMFQIARNDGVIPLIKKKGNFDWQSEVILALARRAPFKSIQSLCSKNLFRKS